jgi:LPXTG-motif cell wall-anchored protein/uncharacterized repeat protein (TIGR02543 family)
MSSHSLNPRNSLPTIKISKFIAAVLSLFVSLGMTSFAILAPHSTAYAAQIANLTVTSTGPLEAGQVNSAPIVVSFTAPTAMTSNANNSAYISLVGVLPVSSVSGQCTGLVTVQNDQGINNNCSAFGSPNVSSQAMSDFNSPVNWPANTTWTFTIAANTVTLPNAATFNVSAMTFVASSPPVQIDSASVSVPLTGYVAPSSTVTFNANGGSGAMADQTASSATALTTNAFTRSGYTFAGWATSPTGTVAYADAASYTFGSSVTLYAVWTPVLATTGFDSSSSLIGGIGLAMAGTVLFFLARRRES